MNWSQEVSYGSRLVLGGVDEDDYDRHQPDMLDEDFYTDDTDEDF